MKKIALLASGAALSLAASLPTYAGVSATAGYVSDYYFRGGNLGDGGAYASLDYEVSGFYIGTWWIDDSTGGNDGLETDFYLGYGMEHGDVFSWNVGYNRYEYTYATSFEHEIDLTLSIGPVAIDIIKGEADPNTDGSDAEDYTVLTVGFEHGPFGGVIGRSEFDDVDDSDRVWAEVSFGGELVAGINASINLGISSDNDGDGQNDQDDGYMYIDLSRSFDL